MGYFYGIELTKNGADFDGDECEWLIRGFLSKRLLELGLICRGGFWTWRSGDPAVAVRPGSRSCRSSTASVAPTSRGPPPGG